jgi:hypothetical protein
MRYLLTLAILGFSAYVSLAQDIIYLDRSNPKSDSSFNAAINKWERNSYVPIEKELVKEKFEAGLMRDYTLAYYRIFIENPEQVGTPIFVSNGQGIDNVAWVDKKGNALDRTYTTTYITNFAQTPTNVQRDSFNPWGSSDPLSGLFYGGMNYAANGFRGTPNYRTQNFQFTGGSMYMPTYFSPYGLGF